MKYSLFRYSIVIVAIIIFASVFSARVNNDAQQKTTTPESTLEENNKTATESKPVFAGGILRTNLAIHTIPLNQILDGGPGKDGIPALITPKFIRISEVSNIYPSDARGILVSSGETAKFYPFNIIVWHEIINDDIAGVPIVVTFCPLCASAIVFSATVDGVREYFGVSGKLYQSNLLMYDVTTESLWSQIIGSAVAGDRTLKVLDIFPSNVLTLNEVKQRYPNAQVLSQETGYKRDYNTDPYGDYENNAKLFFPVIINDTSLPTKEIMHIVNVNAKSVAFVRSQLIKNSQATVMVGDMQITARYLNGEISVTNQSGESIPGYSAMWFSWATHHQEDGIVWKG